MAQTRETQSLYDLQSVGHPTRQDFIARARYLGGTSNLWAGRCMRLDPIDFERREWVPNSGWPITYSDVEAYYSRAERVLDLPEMRRVDEAVRVFLSGNGRDAAVFRRAELQPKQVTWAPRPVRFRKAYLRELTACQQIRIYLNANVTELVPNEAGDRVDHVVATTLNGVQLQISARRFVLACGGLENARLLLVSRRRHSNGIGNDQDVVGRYFMEHPRAIFGTVRLSAPLSRSLLLGAPLANGRIQLGIGLSEQLQRREQLLNNYLSLEPQLSKIALQAFQSSANVVRAHMRKRFEGSRAGELRTLLPELRDLAYFLTPQEVMPHFIYKQYARFKALTHRFRKVRDLTIINFSEQVPRRESRVFLGALRDRLNMNTLVLDWNIGHEETASLMRIHGLLAERLVHEGVGRLDNADGRGPAPTYTDASHHLGTTRMSEDPRFGAVDGNARVHGVKNLFIAGSSVFPTVGSANPTVTIVALALRLADHLRRRQ